MKPGQMIECMVETNGWRINPRQPVFWFKPGDRCLLVGLKLEQNVLSLHVLLRSELLSMFFSYDWLDRYWKVIQ